MAQGAGYSVLSLGEGAGASYSDLIVVTYDASEKGIAAAISMEPGKILRLEGMHFEGVSTIVTFESTPEAQVHREAAGAPMVIRLLQRLRLAPAS